MDLFSYPDTSGKTTEDRLEKLYSYMFRLKEEIEAFLTELSNNQKGGTQVSSMSIQDIFNDPDFIDLMDNIKEQTVAEATTKSKLEFTVDYETGELNYVYKGGLNEN